MLTANISFKVSLLIFLTSIIKTQADSLACERKEKHLAVLDFLKESISKAKALQSSCGNDSNKISSNSSECGAKEKVSAYLDIARNLIDVAKEDFSPCEVSSNLIRHVILHEKPADCSEILENGETSSGVYTIWPRNRIMDGKELLVYCDMDTDGGGWTVIQRRGNFSKKIDFHRDWADYKKGFGNISEEFWIGNDNMFALTSQRNYVARFDMENVGKEYRFATYSSFWIDDENSGYMLHFGNYFGTAGDGINESKNMQFSTKDKQYHKANKVCPNEKMGGWWYNHCGHSNPNGINRPGDAGGKTFYINWFPWTKYDSLLMIEIKIRAGK